MIHASKCIYALHGLLPRQSKQRIDRRGNAGTSNKQVTNQTRTYSDSIEGRIPEDKGSEPERVHRVLRPCGMGVERELQCRGRNY
jgi:hypothetical protein